MQNCPAKAHSVATPKAATRPRALVDVVSINRAAGDSHRSYILQLLRRDSFAVQELCAILSMPQPALSHHLKILLNAGLVAKRREGNNIYYRRSLIEAESSMPELMAAIFGALDSVPLSITLSKGIERVYSARSAISRNYFTDHAHEFQTQQARISPARVYADGVAVMIGASHCARVRLLEVGPGSGEVLLRLAGEFEELLAIDNSAAMLQRTREQTTQQGIANVRLMLSDINHLPDDLRADAIVIGMVLHHLPSPDRFFQQARRVLNDPGILVVAELCHHDQTWVQQACGDLWLGFAADELDNWAAVAKFNLGQSQYLAQKNGFRIQIRSYHT